MNRATAVLAFAILAACSSGAPSAPAASPTSTAKPMIFPVRATAAGSAALKGSVTILKTADNAFTLVVDVTGLAPNSVHVSHIHSGTCCSNGPIAIPLADVVADPGGHANVTNNLATPYKGDGWYVNIHSGPDLTTPANAAPIACADLTSTAP